MLCNVEHAALTGNSPGSPLVILLPYRRERRMGSEYRILLSKIQLSAQSMCTSDWMAWLSLQTMHSASLKGQDANPHKNCKLLFLPISLFCIWTTSSLSNMALTEGNLLSLGRGCHIPSEFNHLCAVTCLSEPTVSLLSLYLIKASFPLF